MPITLRVESWETKFGENYVALRSGIIKERRKKNRRRVSKLIRFLCRVSHSKLKFISSLSVIATLVY